MSMPTDANGTSRAFTVTRNGGEFFLWIGKSEDGELLEVSTDISFIAAEMIRYTGLEVMGSGRNIFGVPLEVWAIDLGKSLKGPFPPGSKKGKTMSLAAEWAAFGPSVFVTRDQMVDELKDRAEVTKDVDIRETFRILDQGLNRRFLGQNENID